ncbi:MAG: tRNA 2-thiouridine(34) synthase MnmA [Actinomycetota bacterium]
MGERRSVLVAMSGGVDSSVAACLLQEQGYEVLGSHLRLVDPDGAGEEVEHGCCGPRARGDAAEVARIRGFDFEVVDLSEVFERTVLADFYEEHAAGRTPNPCVRCNEQIKFGAFVRRADEIGVDAVATGHYVRSERDAHGAWRLLRGADRAKDQSYVLHTLGQPELARSMFPVGSMPKSRTRVLAHRLGLPVADKPDSQEVCFVPDADHAAFLETHAPQLVREGEIVDAASGEVLGAHRGTFRFTIGQRRGLGISRSEPTYVVDMDPVANRVLVGPGELLARGGLVADRVSWVAGRAPSTASFDAGVRLRSQGDDVSSIVEVHADTIRVSFGAPQRGVAPGQSVVIYRGDELLGGGRIVEALRLSARETESA